MHRIMNVACVADVGTKIVVTLGMVDLAADSTVTENAGASLRESMQLLHRISWRRSGSSHGSRL